MSGVLEKTLSGLVHGILGASTTKSPISQSWGNVSGLKNVSLGLVNFVEKLQSARRISKQEEEHCIEHESKEWVKVLSSPGISSAVVADLLCRALIARVRGYDLPNLHIHAIKLTQCPIVLHKKIGYLYVSQSLGPGSELTLLLVNTIQRDLAAPHASQVGAALASLPTIVTPDLTPSFICALTHCLAHQQVYIRRRAASMVGVVAARCGEELDASDQIPHLLHLLTDQDPGVALAAINSLCKIYKVCNCQKTDLREQVAQSASHLLTQAVNGALPKDYQVNALPAPFVQMQMLRVIQQLSSRDWLVPESVMEALELVMRQPWGGKEMALYSILLESVFTVTALPHNDGLIASALKVVLGFLKSINIDLKYVGLKALASVFSVLEDALTPTHLEAVLDCLYHSNASLQSKTLALLCAMANSFNYQAVCATLLEFSSRSKDVGKQKLIYGELSSILKQHCQDVVWCMELLCPLIMNASLPDSRLLESLVSVFQTGFSKEDSVDEASSTSQELLLKMLSLNPLPYVYMNTIACLLNLHYAKDPKQVSKYFTDSFIEKINIMKQDLNENDSTIFQCLKNIGLYDTTVSADVIRLLQPYTRNQNLKVQENSKEICLWLSNSELSLRVMKNREKILNDEVMVDLTLSFLDSYVVESLESGATPFKPFSVIMGNTGFEEKTMTDLNETQWSTPMGSEDTHSSAPSTSTHFTNGTSQSNNMLNRSTIVGTNKKLWSSQGRIRKKSEGETSGRSRVNSTSQSVLHQGNLLGPDDDEEEVTTEGSVEMADEAQEEKEASANQRLHLTQALLSGLGMTRTK